MKHEETTPLSERAAALHKAFDQAFAAVPNAGKSAVTHAFLAIGVGGDNYAVRLSDISELFADKKVVPLPSQVPELLGIASFRGTLIAVYDLRILLGYPASQAPRWLVLATDAMPIALAFDRLDGYLDILPEAIAPSVIMEQTRHYLKESLDAADAVRPVINVAAILETIRRRMQQNSASKER